jgi:hypothetical protein
VITDTSFAQANMTFCSIECMRAFLNECVDHLESTMNEDAQHQNAELSPAAIAPDKA